MKKCLFICVLAMIALVSGLGESNSSRKLYWGSIDPDNEVFLDIQCTDEDTVSGIYRIDWGVEHKFKGTKVDVSRYQLVERSGDSEDIYINLDIERDRVEGEMIQGGSSTLFTARLISLVADYSFLVSPELYESARIPLFREGELINKKIQQAIAIDPESIIRELDHVYAVDYIPGWTREIDFTISLISSEVVSIVFFVHEYSGGAHGNFRYRTVNIVNSLSGEEELSLQALFSKPDAAQKIISHIIMEALQEEEAFFVSNGMIEDVPFSKIRQFSIGTDGITILFAPYEVGSYAQGAFEVLVPYNEIKEYLKPSFIQKIPRLRSKHYY
ncbi:MAG: DUF3298 domain-containing protein [Spirochaetales bacterium]|nr:DUF3298 domain-containing protein [Spirochaetales bacterium]